MVQDARQVAIAARRALEDRGQHVLVGRPVEQIALVPVGDAEHLRAIGVVAAGGAPVIRGLDGGHQHLDCAGAILLLANDPLDIAEHAVPDRQPGVDAGGSLANETGAKHQLVADDLGVGGCLPGDWEIITGQAHGRRSRVVHAATQQWVGRPCPCCRLATAAAQTGHAVQTSMTRPFALHSVAPRNQGLNGLVRGGFGPAVLCEVRNGVRAEASQGGRRRQTRLTGARAETSGHLSFGGSRDGS